MHVWYKYNPNIEWHILTLFFRLLVYLEYKCNWASTNLTLLNAAALHTSLQGLLPSLCSLFHQVPHPSEHRP